jgi:hypothetical protein
MENAEVHSIDDVLAADAEARRDAQARVAAIRRN